MDIKSIIDLYKDVVVQIATPYSTGTGFYLKEYNLIVTNEHVVHDNKKVIVKLNGNEKQFVKVIYIDNKYDLAFLEVPPNCNLPEVKLGSKLELVEGDTVIAIGHPFGFKYSATRGIISNTNHKENNTTYLQHDAALNPGNSGGPLINENAEIVGVNTFIIRDGNSIGFSLPAHYVIATLDEFLKGGLEQGARCESCLNVVLENTIENGYCPHCGYKLMMISEIEDYEPYGINKIIESILGSIEIDVEMSRRGPNYWEIEEFGNKINIQYLSDFNFVIGNALMCALPQGDIKKIYEYLLKQNDLLDDVIFSINDQFIFLTFKMMSQNLKVDSLKSTLQTMREQVKRYNNILIGEYGGLKVD